MSLKVWFESHVNSSFNFHFSECSPQNNLHLSRHTHACIEWLYNNRTDVNVNVQTCEAMFSFPLVESLWENLKQNVLLLLLLWYHFQEISYPCQYVIWFDDVWNDENTLFTCWDIGLKMPYNQRQNWHLCWYLAVGRGESK